MKLILLLLSSLLFAKNIVWIKYNIPPYYIINGKDKGYEDLTEDLIRKNLKDYNHTIYQANVKRAVLMIKNLLNACSGLLKSKDREKFMYFSKAVNIIYPNALIIRKDEYNKFKPYIKNNQIDLEKVAQSGKFLFAFGQLNHYGKHIDKVIDKYRYKKTKKFLF